MIYIEATCRACGHSFRIKSRERPPAAAECPCARSSMRIIKAPGSAEFVGSKVVLLGEAEGPAWVEAP